MRKTLGAVIMIVLIASACTDNNKNAQSPNSNPIINENTNNMNSYISMFEIPANDISRAINFYEIILDLKIEKIEMPGMEMGILPYEDQIITGVIIKGEGYVPSSDGVTIYLNGGDDLQIILDKVEKNGGKLIMPKTPHADESGYFALFLDTEGNKLGLNSPN